MYYSNQTSNILGSARTQVYLIEPNFKYITTNPIARKSIRSRILQKIRRIADAGIRKSYESRAQSENYWISQIQL